MGRSFDVTNEAYVSEVSRRLLQHIPLRMELDVIIWYCLDAFSKCHSSIHASRMRTRQVGRWKSQQPIP
jgi:hypothetical protein